MGKKTLIVSPILKKNIAKSILYLRRHARSGKNMATLFPNDTKLLITFNEQKNDCYYLANYLSNMLKRMS